MTERKPTWLVTGGQGFLGTNLGRHLGTSVHRVGSARNTPSPGVASDTSTFDEWVAADLAHPDALAAWIREHRPDVIVHAAAMATHEGCEADPELARIINADAPGALSAAAREAASRFILISTDAVFEGARGNYTEEDTPAPFSVYGHTKLEGENQVLQQNPEALVVRTNFFGWSPTRTRSILEFFVNALTNNTPVRGFTDFTVTSAYVGALSEALEGLASTNAKGLLHVTSPDAMSKYEFGVAVAEEFGLDQSLITPTRADVDPPRNRDLSLDNTKVSGILNHALQTQRGGIVRAHEAQPKGHA